MTYRRNGWNFFLTIANYEMLQQKWKILVDWKIKIENFTNWAFLWGLNKPFWWVLVFFAIFKPTNGECNL